jgi:deoxyribodipyrimidine photolyase-related protein
VLEDDHFLCPLPDFAEWAEGRKELRLENFYRWMRKRTGLLMDDGEPVGGAWNFDKDNRKSFGKRGPGLLPKPTGFAPDAITREVMALVEERFPDAPGELTPSTGR